MSCHAIRPATSYCSLESRPRDVLRLWQLTLGRYVFGAFRGACLEGNVPANAATSCKHIDLGEYQWAVKETNWGPLLKPPSKTWPARTPIPVPHPHQSLEGNKKPAMALVPGSNCYFFAEMSETIKAYYEAVESPLACMMLAIVPARSHVFFGRKKNTERLWKPLKPVRVPQYSIANLSTPPGKPHHFFPKHIYTHRIHAWYIYLHERFNCMVNVGKYTIHGWYGLYPSSWAKLLQSSIEFKRIKRGGGPACAKTPGAQCV